MRPTAPSARAASILSAVSVLAVMALGFGACAGSRTASNPCLDKCTRSASSSLERSTCELECKQTASAPTQDQAAPAPAPAPASDPGQPQPAQSAPAATGPKQYAGDTGPRQAPPGRPTVSTTPPPGTTTPASPPEPNMAQLRAQRAQCETTCDADARPSDRATCRLQCAQITDRPASTAVPPSTGTGGSGGGAMQPAPADRASIAACEATCNSDATRPTDRATCRLNCNAVGTVGPAPTTHNVLHGSAPAGTNRADVIRSSGGVVPQSSRPPAMTPADAQKAAQCASQAQQCSSACSTQQEPCNRGCDEGKLSATDRATCKLTCESNVDVCRDDCRIKEGACRGPTVRK